MQIPVEVCRVVTWRRDVFQNGSDTSGDTKTVEYYISNNPDPNASTWTKITGSGNTWIEHVCTLDTDPLISGQSLKLVCTESNRDGQTQICEVDVYKFE
jgi:hypothetical protein